MAMLQSRPSCSNVIPSSFWVGSGASGATCHLRLVRAGPLLQAVVWHDGAAWRAALDTSDLHADPGPGGGARAGALAAATPMTNFRAERQYGTFSAEDACNYALNIYDAGAVLSIVVDADPHGTHVAGIAAACHPDAPELNGAAPGARAAAKIHNTQ